MLLAVNFLGTEFLFNIKMFHNFRVISNDIKSLQFTKKQLKIIEYLNSKLMLNGVLFLQETLLTLKDETQWRDDFKAELFFTRYFKFMLSFNCFTWDK